jgi:hypothetical protein
MPSTSTFCVFHRQSSTCGSSAMIDSVAHAASVATDGVHQGADACARVGRRSSEPIRMLPRHDPDQLSMSTFPETRRLRCTVLLTSRRCPTPTGRSRRWGIPGWWDFDERVPDEMCNAFRDNEPYAGHASARPMGVGGATGRAPTSPSAEYPYHRGRLQGARDGGVEGSGRGPPTRRASIRRPDGWRVVPLTAPLGRSKMAGRLGSGDWSCFG